jgi:hypothetical protein
LKLIPTYFPGLRDFTDFAATVVVLTVVSALSIYITVRMVLGAKREVAAKKASLAPHAG